MTINFVSHGPSSIPDPVNSDTIPVAAFQTHQRIIPYSGGGDLNNQVNSPVTGYDIFCQGLGFSPQEVKAISSKRKTHFPIFSFLGMYQIYSIMN